MTSSKLSWHFQSLGNETQRIAAASQAKWIKLIDPPIDNPFLGKQIIGRTYMDDGEANAMVALGALGAELWFAKWQPIYINRAYVTLWEGPNEPQPIHDATFRKNLVAFTLRWAELMHRIGKKVIGLCLSVGTPDIAQFADFLPLIGHVDALANHEYGAPNMQAGQSWYCLRYRRFFDVIRQARLSIPPWFITECGIDGGVLSPPQMAMGWRGFTNAQDYMAQLAWYDSELQRDPEVQAATIFTAGPLGWDSFDITPELAHMLADYIASQSGPTSLDTALHSAAEANDVLRVNPDAALCKVGKALQLWPTSNEFAVVYQNQTYIAQRFREPTSARIFVLYCLDGQWQDIRQLIY